VGAIASFGVMSSLPGCLAESGVGTRFPDASLNLPMQYSWALIYLTHHDYNTTAAGVA
jgi:hypothetical protein